MILVPCVLAGTIPIEYGALASLASLRLSHNSLTGALPTSLSGITSMTEIRFAWNRLTGLLPQQWTGMRGLQVRMGTGRETAVHGCVS